ncbi:MAG: hypothetical protein H6Q89_4675, partial [Myxococcaceae bacterium]|nr:hypothetical protein [Myxococcaceae bacterium]
MVAFGRTLMVLLERSSLAVAAALTLCASGCVKEITSDERLDRGTRDLPIEKAIGAAELQKVHCDDTAEALAKARNEDGPETDRVNRYLALYQS